MNVLFLTISRLTDISTRGIYADLMRKFRDEGHKVYIAHPNERRYGQTTCEEERCGVRILSIKTLNLQKTNVVEKGIATLLIERQFRRAIKRYWNDVEFDLVLYSTPPVTFTSVIRSIKQRSPHCISYLLLKDIFPQNAVDLGMFAKWSPLYGYFRHKERMLYRMSDYIGCMSPANVDFIVKHNPKLDVQRIEVAPNSIELPTDKVTIERRAIRQKYGLPTDRPIFIYGGNIGKPQGIDFMCRALQRNSKRRDCHFLIVGSGTEYAKVERWTRELHPENVTLIGTLPKAEYDMLVAACDVGMIFLDHRFTKPNYPSRQLSYLENRMPIVAATDPNSDIGTIAEQNGYGLWCESCDVERFSAMLDKMLASTEQIAEMGERGYRFLVGNYLTEHTYSAIVKHLNPITK